jgi:hypothetical protein
MLRDIQKSLPVTMLKFIKEDYIAGRDGDLLPIDAQLATARRRRLPRRRPVDREPF